MCSAACPADCIHITPGPSPSAEGKERYPVQFDIDLLRCIFCGFCEMACPEEAIELTEIYDFSDYTREDLIIDKDGLLEVFELTKDQKYYSRKNYSQESKA
jgi:NADH-quinone oxidoreductase subunit I